MSSGQRLVGRKGDEIVCECGHVCGQLLADIAEGEDILPKSGMQFGLDLPTTTNHSIGAGSHHCPECGRPVTRLRNGSYAIRLQSGWIGR